MGCATILCEILTSDKGEICLGCYVLYVDLGGRNAHFRKNGSKPSVAMMLGSECPRFFSILALDTVAL
jgi:hypothetical protein